jgi:hypothetical protein
MKTITVDLRTCTADEASALPAINTRTVARGRKHRFDPHDP